MKTVLHLLTRPSDDLAQKVIAAQRARNDLTVSMIDLTEGKPDYKALIEKVFAADSVDIW